MNNIHFKAFLKKAKSLHMIEKTYSKSQNGGKKLIVILKYVSLKCVDLINKHFNMFEK